MLSHRDDVADVFDRVRGRLRRISIKVFKEEDKGEQQSRVSVSTVQQLGRGDRFEITRVRTGVSRRARHLGRAEISFIRRRYKRRLRRGGKKRVREEVRDVVSKGGRRRRRTPPTPLKIIRMGLMFANASRERIDDDDDDDDDD